MNKVAEDVWQIPLTPRNGVNAYLVGDILVDAGYILHGKKVVAAVKGHEVRTHALTHVHNDHAGGSKHVHETLGVPVWIGVADAPYLRDGTAPIPPRSSALIHSSTRSAAPRGRARARAARG